MRIARLISSIAVIGGLLLAAGSGAVDTTPTADALELSCASQPSGLIGYADTVGGTPNYFDVEGDYAYVGDYTSRGASRGTFQVFDVSDPCNPVRLPGDVWLTQEFTGVEVIGDQAYIANDANGFVVYDVADPSNPTYVEGRSDGTYAFRMDYDGGQYAFVAYGYTAGRELAIYDMDTFPGSSPVATYDGLGDRHGTEIEVVGDRGYFVGGEPRIFEILDLSDVYSPTRIGALHFTWPYDDFGYPHSIEVRGDHAYVATVAHAPSHRHGLVVINLLDEANPIVVSFVDASVAGGSWNPAGLDVVGDTVYLVAANGFNIIDVSDPTNPTLIETWAFPTGSLGAGGGFDVVVRDGLAYVTVASRQGQPADGGLAIYKLDGQVNEPPVSVSGGPYLGPVDVEIGFDGTASSDPEAGTLKYDWDWGDTTTSPDAGATPAHAYGATGIYDVCLTVTDPDGASATACTYAVVYDPDGGFVTGGGWIDSPEGAYVADPPLTGKATFGFVSRYKKGAEVPTGNTEFQFHAAGLNLHSDSYDWLVVTGNDDAMFNGDGTINGMVGYMFKVWAGDDAPDTFRIKIWTEDGAGAETIVYDNGMHQPISGGNIIIHTKNK